MGLGLHGGGLGTVKFLLKEGAKVTVTDLRSRRELSPALKSLSRFPIRYTLGRHSPNDVLRADLIVKNPGVPPDSPYLALARKRGILVTSDVGIFFRRCPARVIGVTGTRGKSTTAFLIYKFLRSKNKRVFLGGNIRKSVLELLPKIKKGDWVALELSSFQLEDLSQKRMSPQIAVLTNIYRDHLNWHKTMRQYIRAKSYIFKFQNKSDLLFASPEDPTVRRMVKSAPSRVFLPRLPGEFKKITDLNLGPHYRSAVALAVAVARVFGVKKAQMAKVLEEFRGLEGRGGYLGKVRGVYFVNDTTATIPDATVAAIKRFRGKAGGNKLILIAGGQDKKLDFKNMARAIYQNVDMLLLFPGTATKKIKDQKLKIKDFPPTVETASMKEAVKAAFRAAQEGDWVLLSPGAASFGLFLNEFDRGDKFVKAVRELG